MKKILRTLYIALVAIVVFLGGLLICEGVINADQHHSAERTKLLFLFDFFEEGSAV